MIKNIYNKVFLHSKMSPIQQSHLYFSSNDFTSPFINIPELSCCKTKTNKLGLR